MTHRLYTIGHSTRATDEFIDLLGEHRIGLLVDVRSLPGSRYNPQFNQENLADSLEARRIRYRHARDLGGRRRSHKRSVNDAWHNAGFRNYADYMQTDEFRAGLETLLDETDEQPTAVMCAEAVPWSCHRWLLSDAAFIRDWEVVHIMGPDQTKAHRLTSFAKVEGTRITYPFEKAFG